MIELPFILYVPFFISAHLARQAEMTECLRQNMLLRAFESVVLLPESVELLARPAMLPRSVHLEIDRSVEPRRRTFADIFDLIRARHRYQPHVAVIANNDILFDESLESVRALSSLRGVALALSRWHAHERTFQPREVFRRADSQDAWIVDSHDVPVRNLSVGAFMLGQPGCDNRLAYELQHTARLCVLNPALTVKVTHVHFSNHRTYTKNRKDAVVPAPYLQVPPKALTLTPNKTAHCTISVQSRRKSPNGALRSRLLAMKRLRNKS